ncbi:MAG: Mur ligase domain-containing protein, partial [Acidobacteriota bacterium]
MVDSDSPQAPSLPSRVHLIGICGTGMGSLARLFKSAGCQVRGSDAAAFPPMSLQLAAAGIDVLVGYDAVHLDWNPDLVVVGNIARQDNPEAVEAGRRSMTLCSMAAAISRFFLEGRHPVVIAG